MEVLTRPPSEKIHLAEITKFEVRSIWDPEARRYAAQLINEGNPVGVFNRGVNAMWGDGANYKFVDRVREIKGEQRNGRPLAATLKTVQVVDLIDSTLIPEKLYPILLNAHEMSSMLGSLCFIRIPITLKAASTLPESMISFSKEGVPFLQNWDPSGHYPTDALIKEVYKLDIRYPAGRCYTAFFKWSER